MLIPGPLDSNVESPHFLALPLSLCPRSMAEVKSGLKHGEIIPAHCGLLHQKHALLQMQPVKSFCQHTAQALATCLVAVSPLVMILYKDFGGED